MKVITYAEFQMTDTLGEYLPVREVHYTHDGPVARAGGGKGGSVGKDLKLGKFNKILKTNAKLTKELGLEELDFAKEQWASQKELLDRVLETQQGIQDSTIGQAADWQARYDEQFQPLEQQLVADANDYASPWRRQQEAGIAAADVGQAFNAERENARKRLEGYGIDPSQTRAQALDNDVLANEALAKAGAMNQARRTVDDKGRELRGQAIALGQANAANANRARGLAFDQGSGQLQNLNTGLVAGQSLRQNAILPYLSATNQATQQQAQNKVAQYQSQLDQQKLTNSVADPGIAGAIGTIGGAFMGGPAGAALGAKLFAADGGYIQGIPANEPYKAAGGMEPRAPTMGYYADGGPIDIEAIQTGEDSYDATMGYKDIGTQDGEVDGPGGPRDDLIDAKLSDGEYVIPADVVEQKGVEFFHNIVASTRKKKPSPQQNGNAMISVPGDEMMEGAERPTALPMANGGFVGGYAIPLAGGGHVKLRRS